MGATAPTRRSSYTAPPLAIVRVSSLGALLDGVRAIAAPGQRSLPGARPEDQPLYLAGDVELARRPTVAIVGARKVSPEGLRRAARLARELVAAEVVVVSGLAEGIDTAAHRATLEHAGRTIAVIGTPLDRVYPAFNAALQEEIYRHHLLVSPFAPGARVGAGNFPERNKVMATIADATVIIEASDTSGSLHQASKCRELGRPLFIARSVVENRLLAWPERFVGKPNVYILDKTDDVLDRVLPCRL